MDSTQQNFQNALNLLISQVRQDRSILAAILCGSLSHDIVWAKSDIDLALVTVDDKNIEGRGLSLNVDGINIHVFLLPRSEFRKTAEGAIRNSFMHSLLAKGRLLYTHDETLAGLCASLQAIGERDTQHQLLQTGLRALQPIDKANKFFLTRGDLNYSALWILFAANALARIEVLNARLLADREVMPQALKLNPDLFNTIYVDLLNEAKTPDAIKRALTAIDNYLGERARVIFRPILEHLAEAGEARSATEIDTHFRRNFNIESAALGCEYLAAAKLLTKVSVPVQLTKRSNISVEEQAFIYHVE